ncbi:hypothetical protein GDO86_001607, partial [Hymenochirus boettgeri]
DVIIVFSGKNTGQSVSQEGSSWFVIAGERVILNCTFQASVLSYLYWYIQYPNKPPQLLISDLSNQGTRGFFTKKDSDNMFYYLIKEKIEIEDSAVYHCALRDTMF